MLRRYFQSTLTVDSISAAKYNPFKEHVMELVEKARLNYMNLSFNSACEAVIDIANAGNVYLDDAYGDQERWTRMSSLNTAGSYKFSSDRTIHEYAKGI